MDHFYKAPDGSLHCLSDEDLANGRTQVETPRTDAHGNLVMELVRDGADEPMLLPERDEAGEFVRDEAGEVVRDEAGEVRSAPMMRAVVDVSEGPNRTLALLPADSVEISADEYAQLAAAIEAAARTVPAPMVDPVEKLQRFLNANPDVAALLK